MLVGGGMSLLQSLQSRARGACAPPRTQVFDEYDEEVQDAEAAEAAVGPQNDEKDSELKPFHHKQRWACRCVPCVCVCPVSAVPYAIT